MSVLLLRLAGSMQSWGVQSRFGVRDTGREPSNSGVIGLLCAALGRPRSESVADLAALKMGVRVDREGRLARDYHTAQDVVRADGSGRQDTVISSRYYLADADFLVGLEGELPLLQALDAALRRPVWPLCLGRKSFVPGLPVPLSDRAGAIRRGDLLDVLCAYPWFRRNQEKNPDPLRYVIEVPFAARDPARVIEPRMDVPLSFADRSFTVRHVLIDFFPEGPEIRELEPDHVSEQAAS